jgi:hypothetical protein
MNITNLALAKLRAETAALVNRVEFHGGSMGNKFNIATNISNIEYDTRFAKANRRLFGKW